MGNWVDPHVTYFLQMRVPIVIDLIVCSLGQVGCYCRPPDLNEKNDQSFKIHVSIISLYSLGGDNFWSESRRITPQIIFLKMQYYKHTS